MELFLLFGLDDLPSLVKATRRANTMGQHRLITLAAILNLQRLDGVMAAPVISLRF
jgi:hypothetical protein